MLNWGPTHFAIKINVAALQVKVFHPIIRCSLLAEMIFDTPWIAGTETGSVNYHIRSLFPPLGDSGAMQHYFLS